MAPQLFVPKIHFITGTIAIEDEKKLDEVLANLDKQLADFFEVAESTLNLWKLDFPEFSEALKLSKEEADKRVEQSLYRRALGYSHEAVKIFKNRGECCLAMAG